MFLALHTRGQRRSSRSSVVGRVWLNCSWRRPVAKPVEAQRNAGQKQNGGTIIKKKKIKRRLRLETKGARFPETDAALRRRGCGEKEREGWGLKESTEEREKRRRKAWKNSRVAGGGRGDERDWVEQGKGRSNDGKCVAGRRASSRLVTEQRTDDECRATRCFN